MESGMIRFMFIESLGRSNQIIVAFAFYEMLITSFLTFEIDVTGEYLRKSTRVFENANEYTVGTGRIKRDPLSAAQAAGISSRWV